ncbi:hypothetical protein SLEP1_g8115 [Rubroshorea leprosula]|uniref:AB hydrolase-1 domain-containing protein n=1 Tax=Rubroshorea leprosula TaxID=152421 RepID=A0AAV5I6L5_9ROSI|nr:hypothetical protein SLEP1_g8115 [Rubroshorea leprosula]
MEGAKQSHFILVHGVCHGAWSWYKLKPLLESVGHRARPGCLRHQPKGHQGSIPCISIPSPEPLLEILAALPSGQRVILAGHSLGGLNLALAMDKFPKKISVGVFIADFMPDTTHRPSYVLDQDLELAETMIRLGLGSLFIQDLAKANEFSNEGYGSARRTYVVCNEGDTRRVPTLDDRKFSGERYDGD